MEEDLGVCSHLHAFNACLFPLRERGHEFYGIVLEDAEAEGTYCVVGFEAGAINCGDFYGGGRPRYRCYIGVEVKAGIAWSEEGGCFALDEVVIPALVEDVVAVFAKSVE